MLEYIDKIIAIEKKNGWRKKKNVWLETIKNLENSLKKAEEETDKFIKETIVRVYILNLLGNRVAVIPGDTVTMHRIHRNSQ